MGRINHLAVIVAAIVFFLLGYLWFSLIFAKPWMAYNPAIATMQGSTMTYVMSFLVALITAYVVAIALSKSADNTAMDGVMFGLFMGIGLVAVTSINGVIYEARPWGLWLIDEGYVVVGLAIMGAIIAGWKKPATVSP